MPDHWHELEADQEGRRKNACEMNDDADSIECSSPKVITFSRKGTGCIAKSRTAENIVEPYEHQPGKGESQQGADEIEEQGKIITLSKAQRSINSSHKGDKAGSGRHLCFGHSVDSGLGDWSGGCRVVRATGDADARMQVMLTRLEDCPNS